MRCPRRSSAWCNGARAAALSAERNRGTAASNFRRLETQAAAALEEMRSLVFALRPKSLERDGLAATLQEHVNGLREAHNAPIELRIDGDRRLSPDQELALLRIAQEAMHNALKHADAPTISVQLRHAASSTQLTVSDRGRGFDPGHLPRTARTMGLQGMRERAAAVGATLTIEARPQQGCTIRVSLPDGAHPAR